MKKIIAINGSPNKNGNTYYLLEKAGEIIRNDGVNFEILNLNDALSRLKTPFCLVCSSPCNQSCYKNSEFHEVVEKAAEADGIIFGSPVYFGSMTAQLKCFFDKMRFYRAQKTFFRKPGAVVTIGASKYGGEETTMRAIHDSMLVLGMQVINNGFPEFDCGHLGASTNNSDINDEITKRKITALAKRMILEIKE